MSHIHVLGEGGTVEVKSGQCIMTRVTAQGLIHWNAEAKDSILFLGSNETRERDRQDEPKGGADPHDDQF